MRMDAYSCTADIDTVYDVSVDRVFQTCLDYRHGRKSRLHLQRDLVVYIDLESVLLTHIRILVQVSTL